MVLVSYKNNTQELRKQAHRNLNCIKPFLIVCVKSKASGLPVVLELSHPFIVGPEWLS